MASDSHLKDIWSNPSDPAGAQDALDTNNAPVGLESEPLPNNQSGCDILSPRRIDEPYGDKEATPTQSIKLIELEPVELYSQNLVTPAEEQIEIPGMFTLIRNNEPIIYLLVDNNTHNTIKLLAISLSTKQVKTITLPQQNPQEKVVRVAYDWRTIGKPALLLIIQTPKITDNVNSKQDHCLVALYHDQATNTWPLVLRSEPFLFDDKLGDFVCYDDSIILLATHQSHLYSCDIPMEHEETEPELTIRTDAKELFYHFAVTCIDSIILIAFSRKDKVDIYRLITKNKKLTLEKPSKYSYPIKDPQMLLFNKQLLFVLVTDCDQHPMQQFIVPIVASYSNSCCNLKRLPARLNLSKNVNVGQWCFVNGQLYVWDLFSETLLSYVIPTEQLFNNQQERKYAEETACASSRERQSKDN